MTWMVVLLIVVTIWAILENYWRRKHTERESFWRGCAVDAMANAAEVREQQLRQDRRWAARKSRTAVNPGKVLAGPDDIDVTKL